MTKLTSLTHLILNNITITEEVREEILTVITNNMELQHIEISGHLKRGLSRSISVATKDHKHIAFKKITSTNI